MDTYSDDEEEHEEHVEGKVHLLAGAVCPLPARLLLGVRSLHTSYTQSSLY